MPKPVIDYKKCSKCGSCVEICPLQVFVLEKGRPVVKKPDECIGCRACEANCPKEAISVKD